MDRKKEVSPLKRSLRSVAQLIKMVFSGFSLQKLPFKFYLCQTPGHLSLGSLDCVKFKHIQELLGPLGLGVLEELLRRGLLGHHAAV